MPSKKGICIIFRYKKVNVSQLCWLVMLEFFHMQTFRPLWEYVRWRNLDTPFEDKYAFSCQKIGKLLIKFIVNPRSVQGKFPILVIV